MLTREQYDTLTGRTVYDRNGTKIGDVGQVWTDQAARPTWVSVKTGLFGLRESLVPLDNADITGDDLVVPLEKSQVKDAPHIDVAHDEPLTSGEIGRLYQHYGMTGYHSGVGTGTYDQTPSGTYADGTGYGDTTGTAAYDDTADQAGRGTRNSYGENRTGAAGGQGAYGDNQLGYADGQTAYGEGRTGYDENRTPGTTGLNGRGAGYDEDPTFGDARTDSERTRLRRYVAKDGDTDATDDSRRDLS